MSGYGYSGGRSRCHSFWIEFQKCYVGADHPKECTDRMGDYLECVHHTKEVARQLAIKAEFLKKEKELVSKAELDATSPFISLGVVKTQ